MRTTESERPEDEAADALSALMDDCSCESPLANAWPDGSITCRKCGKLLGDWKGG